MKTMKIFFLSALSVLAIFTIISPAVLAQGTGNCKETFFGIPVWYKYLKVDDNCNINTKDEQNIPAKIILGIIDIALFLAGLLAVIMIIWGGFMFIFANGEPGAIASARKTILNAVIGLIIAILASQIVRFVAYLLSK
jgi:hypothetical protein